MLSWNKTLDLLPESVQKNMKAADDVRLKDGKKAIRLTIGKLLTANEKRMIMKRGKKHIAGIDCVWNYRYGPEIKGSYFYVV